MPGEWSRRAFISRTVGATTTAFALGACARSRDPSTRCPTPESTNVATPSTAATAPDSADARVEAFAGLKGYCDGIAPVSELERAERRGRLRALMRAAKIDALVVEAGTTMAYFGGVRWGRSERPMQLILRADDETPRWIAPSFEAGTLRARLSSVGVDDPQLTTWDEHQSPYEVAARMLLPGRRSTRVAFDSETRRFVVEGWRTDAGLERPFDGTGVVEACRMIKTQLELSRLRRANEATKAALAAVAPRVEPGMRESEVAHMVRSAQTAAGLSDIWVLALADASAAYPHGAQTDAEVREGRLVLIDTGGFLHGYASDITRTFGVGEVTDPELSAAYEAVRAAQSAALDAIVAGRTCGEADEVARTVIATAGFGDGYEQFTHRLGHGIGLDVHEAPYLRRDNHRVLEPGMTMSNEPGIYVPGRFGVRIEDIVAVTPDGPEVFGPRAGPLDRVF